MQPTEPIQTASGGLLLGLAKGSSPHALSGRLIETRGNPLLRLPAKIFLDELLQIPTPFNNLPGRWENSDEAEGIYAVER